MIYRRCGRCGKRIQSGSRCGCLKERHKEYDRYSRDKQSKEYYNSKEWEHTRETVLELDGYIDVYQYMETGQIAKADTVHHIKPLREAWNQRSDIDNLISLSHGSHSKIEREYKKKKEEMIPKMQKMLREYRELRRGGGI